jgi:hypothetical protein
MNKRKRKKLLRIALAKGEVVEQVMPEPQVVEQLEPILEPVQEVVVEPTPVVEVPELVTEVKTTKKKKS